MLRCKFRTDCQAKRRLPPAFSDRSETAPLPRAVRSLSFGSRPAYTFALYAASCRTCALQCVMYFAGSAPPFQYGDCESASHSLVSQRCSALMIFFDSTRSAAQRTLFCLIVISSSWVFPFRLFDYKLSTSSFQNGQPD